MAIYTFASALTEISLRLGGRTDILAGTPSRASRWLNSACLMLAECDTDVATLELKAIRPTIIGQAEYRLNTDTEGGFNLTTLLGIRLMRNNTNGQALEWMPWREYRELSSQARSSPVRWSRNGHMLAFDPIPTAVEDILIDFRRVPTLDDLTDFGDKHHETLVNLGVYIGWGALRQYEEALKVKVLLPQYVRQRIEIPMARYDWEAAAGTKARVTPYYE